MVLLVDSVNAKPGMRRLKVGVMVPAFRVTTWVAALAEALASVGYVDLTLIIAPSGPSRTARPVHSHPSLLWSAFCSIDLALCRLVLRGTPDVSALVELRGFRWAATDHLTASNVFDVLVDAAGKDSASTSRCAKSGVWHFDHDGYLPWGRATGGCLEVLDAVPTTTSRLVMTTGNGESVSLRTANTATHALFASQNRMEMLWKGIPLLLQKLRELAETGTVTFGDDAKADVVTARPVEGSSYPMPAFSWLISRALGHLWRSMFFVLRRLLYREHWHVLCGTLEGVAREGGVHFRPRRELLPASGWSWADPHPIPNSNGTLILVEEYFDLSRRGRIVLLRTDSTGKVEESRTVLDGGGHLSYPSVFQFGDRLHVVPESGADLTVSVFSCAGFPWKWERSGTLLTGVRSFDNTVFEHEGNWWMFATVVEQPWLTPRDTLSIFFTQNPIEGPWQPHPQNPVLVDARKARPAGPLFWYEGRLYRPSQDCSRGYGHGVRINEVTELTRTRYSESERAFLRPDWAAHLSGTHHLAFTPEMTFVDAMTWVPRWRLRQSDAGRGVGAVAYCATAPPS
jgi:hypothetical protein